MLPDNSHSTRAMKGKEQAAVYLTCSRNKSYQRKHVAVCRQCKFNHRCAAFSEYRRSISSEKASDAPGGIDRNRILRHIIQELKEIKRLVSGGSEPSSVSFPAVNKDSIKLHHHIADIKTALDDIRRLC